MSSGRSNAALHLIWVIRHALTRDVPRLTNDQLRLVDPELRPLYQFLRANISQPTEVRKSFVRGYMEDTYSDFDEAASQQFWDDVRAADPYGPIPSYDAVSIPEGLLTMDELPEIPDEQKDLWPGRMTRGCLNLLASNPKVGKTSVLLEFERRLWFGIPTPGSSQLIYPEKTPSLWMLGDDNADEIRDRARSFGIPGKAIQFCASPDNPYDFFTLDQDITLKILEHFIPKENYGMVVVDSALRCTRKRMWDSGDVDAVWKPIIRIVREANVALVATLHTSKDGDSLGRRLEGVARSISKLYRVGKDTTESVRRKLSTTTNRVKTAHDLTLTIHDDRIEFDASSVQESDTEPKKQSGRPSTARDQAKQFMRQLLSTGPETWDAIKSRWSGNRMTLMRARQNLEQSHEIRVTAQEDDQRLELLS
jgi:hypothetical protein